MTVSDLVAHWSKSMAASMGPLAHCLREEGIDLMDLDGTVERGTPVYVDAHVSALEVQSRMARHHIRMLPVIQGNEILGVVDLVELAGQSEMFIENAYIADLVS
jgi:CBS domain-containing protein